jgi:hypothetical protein
MQRQFAEPALLAQRLALGEQGFDWPLRPDLRAAMGQAAAESEQSGQWLDRSAKDPMVRRICGPH